MKKLLTLIALLGLVAGCATQSSDVTSFYDQVTGLRTDLMSDNELESPGQPREMVWLNASRVFRSYNDSDYYLEVNYMARNEVGYLEIPPGPSLVLTVDGERMAFSGTGSQNTRKTYKKELVTENAIFPATKTQLQKIAMAKQVKVQVKGNNGLIERDFGPANFERFRRFVTAYAL